ncbi:MAG: flagellar biosynthetic protein FliR [Alphaproteobacteria bacterium]
MALPFGEFLVANIFAFILVFVRFGTAFMIMPGIGDSFVSERVRLLMALAITFSLFPLLQPLMPSPIPGTFALLMLVIVEFIIGVFFGTIARIFMTALDTAGMVISIHSGLGNAQVFNPSLATQGSLIGAFMMITGVVLLFATNLHHLLIMGIFESYELFPVGGIPDSGSMANMMTMAVNASFTVGVKMAAPFIVITLLIYTGMGVLTRLMPQVQVFMIALPLQILIALITLSLVLFASFAYWLSQFEQGMFYFLSVGG